MSRGRLIRCDTDRGADERIPAWIPFALLDATQPALVVLDTSVRTSEVADLLLQLRRRSEAAVIMLTGRGDEDARVAGLEHGADDYVSKPFSTRELVARIRAIL